MFQRFVIPIAIALTAPFGTAASALAQCSNQITPVPLTEMKAASKPCDFVRFRYSLSNSDSLIIQAHEDTETSIGPYDTGFAITRNGKTIQSVSLRNLPEFQSEDPWFSDAFTTLAVTRVCGSAGLVYFVTMQYEGDETSPASAFTIVPSATGYEISTLPAFRGGVLEASIANPLHLRVWDRVEEGMCNACKTGYRITEYELRDGKPIRTRTYRTRHLYDSGNYRFDDRRRIRFIP